MESEIERTGRNEREKEGNAEEGGKYGGGIAEIVSQDLFIDMASRLIWLGQFSLLSVKYENASNYFFEAGEMRFAIDRPCGVPFMINLV
ncbi:hypothetical protein Tco_1019065 [Tanacetum coccineum]|uniref:Uncharacterized protein n=1 Tax=Tanacetum coccineum TaxID=301880 RepID=A0ABQ5FWC0_9ASTR